MFPLSHCWIARFLLLPSPLAVTPSLFSIWSPTRQSWVGVMLMKQPFFIGGIDNVERATGNAFGAAGMFFFIFLVSMVHLIRDSNGSSSHGSSNSSNPGVTTTFHDDAEEFDGWSGQRRSVTDGAYGQVPVFTDFEEENDGGMEQHVGFLS
jgi:hypothetical protein